MCHCDVTNNALFKRVLANQRAVKFKHDLIHLPLMHFTSENVTHIVEVACEQEDMRANSVAGAGLDCRTRLFERCDTTGSVI